MNQTTLVGQEKHGYRVLHTADWHLGLKLGELDCHEEQEKFLKWLTDFITENQVDALVVSGDIFDTKSVSNLTQRHYSELIDRLCDVKDCDVYLLGGNHDSADFLDVNRELYGKRLGVHVYGAMAEKLEKVPVMLKDRSGQPRVMFLPIPNIPRTFAANFKTADNDVAETAEKLPWEARYRKAVEAYLSAVVDTAKAANTQGVPMMMAAHFAVAKEKGTDDSAETVPGDELVGNLLPISTKMFPPELAYVALGHIHHGGFCDSQERVCYSGSVFPTSVDDDSEKSVMLLEFGDDGSLSYERVPIGPFINTFQLKGTVDEIKAHFGEIAKNTTCATLVTVTYQAEDRHGTLEAELNEMCANVPKLQLTEVHWEIPPDKKEQLKKVEETKRKRLVEKLDSEDPMPLLVSLFTQKAMGDERKTKLLSLVAGLIDAAKSELDAERTKTENDLRESEEKALQAVKEAADKQALKDAKEAEKAKREAEKEAKRAQRAAERAQRAGRRRNAAGAAAGQQNQEEQPEA